MTDRLLDDLTSPGALTASASAALLFSLICLHSEEFSLALTFGVFAVACAGLRYSLWLGALDGTI